MNEVGRDVVERLVQVSEAAVALLVLGGRTPKDARDGLAGGVLGEGVRLRRGMARRVAAAVASGLGPSVAQLREPWLAEISAFFGEVNLPLPAEGRFRSTGRQGVHSEHMGYILAEMQHLQRAFPGGAW